MLFLKHWCEKISQIGVDESLSVYKRKRLLVFNGLNAFGFLLAVVWFVQLSFLSTVKQNFGSTLLNVLPAIITIISIYLIYKKKYKIAIYINTIVIPFVLCVASFSLQEGTVLLYLIVYSIFPFIYHTKLYKIILHFFYVIALYTCSHYFFKLHLPYNQIFFSPLLQVVAILFLFATLFYVKVQVMAYENLLKKNKEELDFTNKELMKMLILKDQIFTVVSHDIIVPLHSMKIITTHIMENGYESNNIKELFPMMRDEIVKTHNLFTNLLEWSKAQQEGRGNITTEVAVFDLTNKVLVQTQSQAKLKSITIVNNIDVDIVADVNPENLMVAIRNLIVNAIKFTPALGTITLSSSETNKHVQINISDTGAGVDNETLNKIFGKELYTSMGTSAETGNGFGLKISNELIKQNGGTVFCESSTIGKGSTFAIKMPIGKERKITMLQEI